MAAGAVESAHRWICPDPAAILARMTAPHRLQRPGATMARRAAALLALAMTVACSGDEGASVGAPVTLGTHTVGEPIEESFVAAMSGGPLPVVLGGQGSTMVACAVRLTQTLDPATAYTVDFSLALGDAEPRPVRVKRNPVLGSDGFYYFTDLYLIVAANVTDDSWEGREATLAVQVRLNSTVPPLAEGSVAGKLSDHRGPPTLGVSSDLGAPRDATSAEAPDVPEPAPAPRAPDADSAAPSDDAPDAD